MLTESDGFVLKGVPLTGVDGRLLFKSVLLVLACLDSARAYG